MRRIALGSASALILASDIRLPPEGLTGTVFGSSRRHPTYGAPP